MPLKLSIADQDQLRAWLCTGSMPRQIAMRCRITLAASLGRKDVEIATEYKVNRHTVELWRKRVITEGIGCLWKIADGRGRPPKYGSRKRSALINATLHANSPGSSPWTCRSLAAALGVSKNTANRLWDLHNLRRHPTATSRLPLDSATTGSSTDILGLYLNPPHKVMVLRVFKNRLIQSLARERPVSPITEGRGRTVTRKEDHGRTTTLFEKLRRLDGLVIGHRSSWHRQQEFLEFLRHVDRSFPESWTLNLVMDKHGVHQSGKVQQWLAHHRRFVSHCILIHPGWVSQIKQWSRNTVRTEARPGRFASVPRLIKAIEAYLTARGTEPKPFVWIASMQEGICGSENLRSGQLIAQGSPGFNTRDSRIRAQRSPPKHKFH